MSMGCRWQVRWPPDKGTRRCEASSPERMLWLRTHSRGKSLPREGPHLGERTGRCVRVSRLHSGEIGAQSDTALSLCWTETSLPATAPSVCFPPYSADYKALSSALVPLSLAFASAWCDRHRLDHMKWQRLTAFDLPELRCQCTGLQTSAEAHSWITTRWSRYRTWSGVGIMEVREALSGVYMCKKMNTHLAAMDMFSIPIAPPFLETCEWKNTSRLWLCYFISYHPCIHPGYRIKAFFQFTEQQDLKCTNSPQCVRAFASGETSGVFPVWVDY